MLFNYFFFFVTLALDILPARFDGGFFIVPLSIALITDSERIAALAIYLFVEPFFCALLIAARVFPPVFLPATPFLGAAFFIGLAMTIPLVN